MARTTHYLRFGIRPYCRGCGYWTGRIANVCQSCQRKWPGIRGRFVWQAPIIALLIALSVFAAAGVALAGPS